MDILDEREKDYGDAIESFRNVSVVASIITGIKLSPEDCVKVMIAVKLVRESYKHKDDNLTDAKGYITILERIINS